MKRTGLTVHAQIHEHAVEDYHRARNKTKREHYTSLILNAAGDQGSLFGIMDQLLQKNSDLPLPLHDSPRELASDFATFFVNKVLKIQSSLTVPPSATGSPISFPEPLAKSSLPAFTPLTIKGVAALIKNSLSSPAVLIPSQPRSSKPAPKLSFLLSHPSSTCLFGMGLCLGPSRGLS